MPATGGVLEDHTIAVQVRLTNVGNVLLIGDDRVDHHGCSGSLDEDAGVAAGLEPVAWVVAKHRFLDDEGPGVVVAHEEDGASTFVGMVVLDRAPQESQGERVAIEVYRATTAASRRATLLRIGTPADGLVVAKDAVDDGPRDPDAADATAVGADASLESGVDDVDRKILVLAEHAQGGTADVGASRVTSIPDELAVHNLESAASHEDGAPSPASFETFGGTGRVAIHECEVLHREPGVVLVLTVRSCPLLRL